MSAITDARASLIALFRLGDDETQTLIPGLVAAFDHEPKPGDAVAPYLAIWQDGATDDNQFFRFEVRVYAEMSTSARDGQTIFDQLCLDVDEVFDVDTEFVCTGWDTEWNGDLLIAMFAVRVGRTDVW